jgi:hypothetical protein
MKKKLTWRGSWDGFDHLLRSKTDIEGVEDPLLHVKNQLKSSLAKATEGLAQNIKQQLTSPVIFGSTVPRYYGVYKVKFEVDTQLNTFFTRLDHWNIIYGEDYQDIVDIHNDVFGSMLNLIEMYNSTQQPIETKVLSDAPSDIRGGFELIIHGDVWNYSYPTKGKAKECRRRGK